jgi:hypothetical protein
MKANADRRRQDLSFAVGVQVLLSPMNLKLKKAAAGAQELMPGWLGLGLFCVQRQVNAVAYELGSSLPESMRVHPVVRVSIQY